MLEAGHYTFSAKLGQRNDLPNRGIIIHESPWIGPLTIEWDYENKVAPFLGMFGLPAKGSFTVLEKSQ
jgi:lipopolysaccharide transport system ATP-binding protein